MQQMPAEGRQFQTVDRFWREIMKFCAEDPKVREIHITNRKQELLSLFLLGGDVLFSEYTQ